MEAGLDRNAAYALALEATGTRPPGSETAQETGEERA